MSKLIWRANIVVILVFVVLGVVAYNQGNTKDEETAEYNYVSPADQVKQINQIKKSRSYKEIEKSIIDRELSKWTVQPGRISLKEIVTGTYTSPYVLFYGNCYMQIIVTSNNTIALYIHEEGTDNFVSLHDGAIIRIKNKKGKNIDIHDLQDLSEIGKGGIIIYDQRVGNMLKESNSIKIVVYDPSTESCYLSTSIDVRGFTISHNSINP